MGNLDKRIRGLQGMSQTETSDMTARVKRLEQEKEILSFAIDMISEEVGTDMLKKYLPESQEVIREEGEKVKHKRSLRRIRVYTTSLLQAVEIKKQRERNQ